MDLVFDGRAVGGGRAWHCAESTVPYPQSSISPPLERPRNAASKRQAQRTLPDAWAKLIEAEDELLIELLSDKVEDLCGVKPDPNAVAAFLRKQPPTDLELASPPSRKKPRRSAQLTPTTTALNATGYELDGQQRQARDARDVLVQIFREFAEREPDFLERFAALPKHGRKRR